MTLQEILNVKGTLIHRIGPDHSLADVVQRLIQHRIGSLVVCQSDCVDDVHMLGIITERDILRAVSERRAPLEDLKVRDYMTVDLATAAPLDDVAQVMGLMTQRRIRHLPIVNDGSLVGLISIGDVVKAQHDQMVMENHYLKSYVNGGLSADSY